MTKPKIPRKPMERREKAATDDADRRCEVPVQSVGAEGTVALSATSPGRLGARAGPLMDEAVEVKHLHLIRPIQPPRGTVALRANDAEPASIGAMAERQSRGARPFTMHLNTRFSAHLMFRVGPRGSMQQCPRAPFGQRSSHRGS